MLKQQFAAAIQALQIKHERAEDYRAKISRDDDCFGIMYEHKHELCAQCTIMVTHEGKDMPINELCKIFSKLPLEQPKEVKVEEQKAEVKPEVATPVEPKPELIPEGQANAPTPGVVAPTPAAVPQVRAPRGQRKEQVLQAIKEGIDTQSGIAKKWDVDVAVVQAIVKKLCEDNVLVRSHDGKVFHYTMKQ